MKLCYGQSLLLLLCTGLFTGCGSDELDPNSSVYHLVSNSPPEQGIFANIDKTDFIDSNGSPTPASKTLARCAILDEDDDIPCTISTLPFLASESLTPSKEQILSRLIVSDRWMADNFAQLLDDMPASLQQDMYRLFASTTAIVIHKNIRPAFFWDTTGAIYLDPYYLWLTQAQKDSISQQDDYRAAFGAQLQFKHLSLYTLANNATPAGFPAFGSGLTRNPTEALYALSALLFHELAHATDFFPANTVAVTGIEQAPYQLVKINNTVSALINGILPLQDSIWHRLAKILFRGEQASSDLTSLTASDVAALFEADGANDTYNYLETPSDNGLNLHFEDTAMLFEETMMKIHFDMNKEMVFAQHLKADPQYCSDLSVEWRAFNRYRDTHVMARAQLAVDNLLPAHSHSAFFSSPPITEDYYLLCPSVTGNARSRNAEPIPVTQHFWH